jgi:hypothetical protein
MKMKLPLSLLTAASLAISSAAFAAGVQDYQVTGPIAELDDTMIVVERGAKNAKKERFEIARDANTKASGEMKVGDKVTVHYTMTATNIEAKAAKAGKGKKEESETAASPAKP